ncbi:MAG: DUF2807 domain-containing protein [Bacteroidales bacterium]|nr:DUF2807 domain-containing protein [Bacteroidales bacterium]
MKKLLLTIAATLSFLALGAEERTKVYEFGDITRLDVSFLYEVHITEGTSGKVTVVYESDYEKHLRVRYRESESLLLLHLNDIPNKFKKGDQPYINVYIEMDHIDAITLMGASKAFFDGEFKSDNLRIDMSAAAGLSGLQVEGENLNMLCSGAAKTGITGHFERSVQIEMSGAAKGRLDINTRRLSGELSGASALAYEGDADDCEFECSGACKIELSGKGKHLDLEGSGACRLNTRYFTADEVSLELSGASRADVYAEKVLRYDVARTCKLTYFGDPELVNLSNDENVVKGY